ncbi:uncharacterized protein LOC133790127 [Humulus lupulus]|uniref:uncharacterized protein LOC133790121 n=1 Tax=Humulus lupulus TaxID=3486 RepID=UPI002B4176DF|nr:uncharacterized protein LOC133790121 [Humulus lupulus]XP_062083656.1 uncharacterized protein LOC133790127 [Humulus lupulus]
MATRMKTLVSLVSLYPKPTISSGIVILRSGSNFNGQKLQKMHFFYKGLQHNKNRAQNKMIAITARSFTREPDHNYRFPEFNNGNIHHLSEDFIKLRSDKTLFFQIIDESHGSQRPTSNQKVVVICTIYNERREVKGIEDEKITLVMGDNNQLGEGFDCAIRNMGENERAIFVIHKNLWPTGSRKPKTGYCSKQKYIVCDVTLVKILG